MGRPTLRRCYQATARTISVWNLVSLQLVTQHLHPMQPVQNCKKSVSKARTFKSQGSA